MKKLILSFEVNEASSFRNSKQFEYENYGKPHTLPRMLKLGDFIQHEPLISIVYNLLSNAISN